MKQMDYRVVGARLRPPRFVVAYRPGPDWIYTARLVVASISRIWGANGAVLVPADDDGATLPALVAFMRPYDPDHVAGHVPTLADLAHADPTFAKRAVQEFASPGEDQDTTWRRLRTEPAGDPDWARLAQQIDAYCSPFKGSDPATRKFEAHKILWLDRTSPSTTAFTTVPDQSEACIFILDLSNVDPALALMVETRIGSIDPTLREDRNIIELPVEDVDLRDLVRLAVTGNVRPTTWDLQARYLNAVDTIRGSDPDLTIDRFLADTPFGRSARWTTSLRSYPEPPIVCVIGDTAEDHALAVMCDRLYHHGTWIPARLLAADAPFATHIKLALHQLRHIPNAPTQPVMLTSLSESTETVVSLATELNEMFPLLDGSGQPIPTNRMFKHVTVENLAMERGRSIIADPSAFELRRFLPLADNEGDVSILTPVPLPEPEAANHIGPNMQWYIDVWLPGHQLPARTSLPSSSLQQVVGLPDAMMRASLDGLTFASPNFGLVMAGASADTRLAHPLLRFPSAEVLFAELARAQEATVEWSDAGRRAAMAVEMWGSFAAAVVDLGGSARQLLDAFIPPKGADGSYGNHTGYAIRGDGYVALEDATTILKVDEFQARDMLDRLLAHNILRRGLLLNCVRCRSEDFYRIEQVGSIFECHACGHDSELSRGRWYEKDAEPHWYYSIDQVVRDLLTQHGDVPLLAAAKLSEGTRSMLWSPETIVQDDNESVELDLCLVIDGRVVVGEAKSNGTLKAKNGPEETARRLVYAAHILSADQIVLATSRNSWAKGQLQLVERAVSNVWTRGPRPSVTCLLGVSAATPA
jgi:hypothetical protein